MDGIALLSNLFCDFLSHRNLTVSKAMQMVQIQGSDKKTKLVITEPQLWVKNVNVPSRINCSGSKA